MARKIDVADGSYILIDTDTVKAWLSEYGKTVTGREASEIIDDIANDNNMWDKLTEMAADSYCDKFGWE